MIVMALSARLAMRLQAQVAEAAVAVQHWVARLQLQRLAHVEPKGACH